MDGDLLVNTRKRRANAGSRLKQLLSAEESAAGEEDDVDLLFVEDEDDKEYNSDSEGDEEEGSEQEGENDSDTEKVAKKTRSREATAEADDEGSGAEDEDNEDDDESDAGPVNDDEMFSDSDDDSSSDGSDDGEKELQKAEKARQRELKKKKKVIPKIKKPTTPKKNKPKKIYEPAKADTLLDGARRQSSRRTAVQNKLDLVEKLKEEETRRSTLKPVQKIEYIEMTQEERLAEAIETEKYNISTLNKYKEQEVDRAKRRRELMMSKRRKLTDVMTIRSVVRYVDIEEERELEKFYLTRDTLKKKDRRGRKSERQRKEEEEERIRDEKMRLRWEMLNNPELSYFDAEKRLLQKDQSEHTPAQAEKNMSIEVKSEDPPAALDGTKSADVTTEKLPTTDTTRQREGTIEVPSDTDDEILLVSSEKYDVAEDLKKENSSELTVEANDATQPTEATEVPKEKDSNETQDAISPDVVEISEKTFGGEAEVVQVSGQNIGDRDVVMADADTTTVIKTEYSDVKMEDAVPEEKVTTRVTPEVKTVTFADQPRKEAKPAPPKVTYEGPKQKVGANFISFENTYTVNKLRSLLFGPQALLQAQRRFTEIEPLVRMRQEPTAISLDPTSSLKLPDLSVLDSFPEFGNFEKVHREITTVKAVKDTKIVFKTEAPTGIFLPSGQRKMCLITGKPAMYFDPNTGMPYADVESYKVIKEIQEGTFKWCEGAYVGNYHAKGVPAGFAD